ncbi:MAG: hypothetical protein E6230_26140 [Paenibacillus dendritiformis]|uniref:hypothetical protein n=1 Tax=uncultured Paenibacillus sp. TaxID=227322 RepID=UPI002601464D|nr:hypothetical protein [uncultured Paenibacillus sp.]MDU5145657.1 hypothetical protein [Paenibacillus dendritiformis]
MGISPNPVYLRDMLAQEMRLQAEQGLSDKELVLTEWNPPPIRELLNETVYKAAYLGNAIVDRLVFYEIISSIHRLLIGYNIGNFVFK